MTASLNIPLNDTAAVARCFSEIKKNDPEDILHSLKLSTTKVKCLSNNVLGDMTKKILAQKLKSQPFTICIDESKSITKEKVLSIEVRFFDFEQFKVETYFWDLYPTFVKGQEALVSAERLFQCVKESFRNYEVPLENIYALSVDGCNTVTGHSGGIKALMESVIPNLITIRCPAHITRLRDYQTQLMHLRRR
ncbi:hypothetical protein TKK_0012063 [Trichogramma kaykai]